VEKRESINKGETGGIRWIRKTRWEGDSTDSTKGVSGGFRSYKQSFFSGDGKWGGGDEGGPIENRKKSISNQGKSNPADK